jgi:hypothetical protein
MTVPLPAGLGLSDFNTVPEAVETVRVHRYYKCLA